MELLYKNRKAYTEHDDATLLATVLFLSRRKPMISEYFGMVRKYPAEIIIVQ